MNAPLFKFTTLIFLNVINLTGNHVQFFVALVIHQDLVENQLPPIVAAIYFCSFIFVLQEKVAGSS